MDLGRVDTSQWITTSFLSSQFRGNRPWPGMFRSGAVTRLFHAGDGLLGLMLCLPPPNAGEPVDTMSRNSGISILAVAALLLALADLASAQEPSPAQPPTRPLQVISVAEFLSLIEDHQLTFVSGIIEGMSFMQ
jgi:hypothetical protein